MLSYIPAVENATYKVREIIQNQKMPDRGNWMSYQNFPIHFLTTGRHTVAISYTSNAHKTLFGGAKLSTLYLPFQIDGIDIKVFKSTCV